MQPKFSTLAAFFINNLKGVYALANIRGGGYGI
jgi:prolyl oligopeptidase PreP (S9A serine peptidase family)